MCGKHSITDGTVNYLSSLFHVLMYIKIVFTGYARTRLSHKKVSSCSKGECFQLKKQS